MRKTVKIKMLKRRIWYNFWYYLKNQKKEEKKEIYVIYVENITQFSYVLAYLLRLFIKVCNALKKLIYEYWQKELNYA